MSTFTKRISGALLAALFLQSLCSFSQKVHFFRSFNYQSLTAALTRGCETDAEKAGRISYWITHHIRYDVKSFIKQKDRRYSPNKVLRRRKAVCYGYSRLFSDMCAQAGVTSAVVSGYDKGWMYDFGDIFFTDEHAWSAYKAGDEWKLSDLTWASGHLWVRFGRIKTLLYKVKLKKYPFKIKFRRQYDAGWINAAPAGFVYDHLPIVNYWQLLNKPVTVSDYENFSSTPYNHSYDSIISGRSYQPVCPDCDHEAAAGYEQQVQFESRKQLAENSRNTFLYLNTVYNSLPPFKKEILDDSLKVKESLGHYDELYELALCNMDNIRSDYELNRNQEKHKMRLFKAYYDSLSGFVKKENRTRKRLKKQVVSNTRTAKRLHLYAVIRLNRLVAQGLHGLTARSALTRAQEKKRDKAERDAGKSLERSVDDFIAALDAVETTDSLHVQDSLDYRSAARRLARENGCSSSTAAMRAGFSDNYDLEVILSADTAADHGLAACRLFVQQLDPRMRISTRYLKKQKRSLKKAIVEMGAVKKNLKLAARNDSRLDPWREDNELLDTMTLALKDRFNREFRLYMKAMGLQKSELLSDWFLLRHIRGSLNSEYFFESCRNIFYTNFYKRRYKKQLLHGKRVLKRVAKERGQLNKNLSALRK